MPKTLSSKIIQIQTAAIPASGNNGDFVELFALCADGSLWMTYRSNGCANVPTDGEWYCMEPAIAARKKKATTRMPKPAMCSVPDPVPTMQFRTRRRQGQLIWKSCTITESSAVSILTNQKPYDVEVRYHDQWHQIDHLAGDHTWAEIVRELFAGTSPYDLERILEGRKANERSTAKD